MWNISGMNGDRLRDPVFFVRGPAAEKKAESERQVRRILLFSGSGTGTGARLTFFVAAGILSGAPDRKKTVNPLDFIMIT